MDTKVKIVARFHREVPIGEGRERKETFAAGQVATVSQEDAADWIEKGLAVAVADTESAP